MAGTLTELFRYLDGLKGRAPLPELTARLTDLDVDTHELADYMHFSSRSYMRNLARAGPWYHALVLCWKNGQRSPIHDHVGSSCGMRVLRGTLTETIFDMAPNGHVYATFSRQLSPGEVSGSEDDDIHQVCNLQPGDADLVTLHVYTPPLRRMGTYSLTDTDRGFEPMFVEFCDAEGI